MPVYTRHRLSASTPDVVPLEVFPSIERAGKALQLRCQRKASGTYFFADRPPGAEGPPGPEIPFPAADSTGFMAVWRRSPSDGPPGADRPDELWHVAPTGGLRRQPWGEAPWKLSDMSGMGQGMDTPADVLRATLTAPQRRAKALAALADVPPTEEAFLADLNSTYLHVLRDLVQDPEAEDAILRVMQCDWKLRQRRD